MQKIAVIVLLAGLVASFLGAYQLLAGQEWFPVCEQGRYWYDWQCNNYCPQGADWMKACWASGGTVACCQHYPEGSWECDCIVE